MSLSAFLGPGSHGGRVPPAPPSLSPPHPTMAGVNHAKQSPSAAERPVAIIVLPKVRSFFTEPLLSRVGRGGRHCTTGANAPPQPAGPGFDASGARAAGAWKAAGA